MKFQIISTVLTGMLCCTAYAGDLEINGDFKGIGTQDIPGWKVIRGKGVRRYQIKNDDDFGVELPSQTRLRSKLVPALGANIRLEAEVRGSGMGRISCIAYDSSGKELADAPESVRFSANSRRSKIRAEVPVAPQAYFVAICLESSADSKVCFEDVEAEFKPPWRNLKAGKTIILTDDRHYTLSSLGQLPFSTRLRLGKDISFSLEESENDRWQIVSVNHRICDVDTEHDRDGVWPFYRYKFEVELEARRTGKTELVLRSTSGREVKVQITVND